MTIALELVVQPAGMDRVVPDSSKSRALAGSTGATAIVTVVSALDAWLMKAVTVLSPPASPIESSESLRETVGAALPSSMVNSALDTARAASDTAPAIRTVSAGSSRSSGAAENEKGLRTAHHARPEW